MSDEFLSGVDKGFENLSGEAFSTPFIKLLQPNSAEVTNEVPGCKPGLFYDSANKEVLGDSLTLIPLDFEILWMEWEENMGGLKGKYLPGTIPTTGDRFNRINAQTGRELSDAWNYYVLLVGREDKGPAIVSLPVTAIKYLKNWNTMIHNTKLSNGEQAPFYSSVWKLGPTVKTKNDSGQVWYNIGDASGVKIERLRFINKEEFTGFVLPGKEMAKTVMLSYQQQQPARPALPPGAPQAVLPSSPEKDQY